MILVFVTIVACSRLDFVPGGVMRSLIKGKLFSGKGVLFAYEFQGEPWWFQCRFSKRVK